MTKTPQKKQRNTKNQFFYLPHPTFIIIITIDRNHYYKCFNCNKLFPTKYRLSRHFILSKCLTSKSKIHISNHKREMSLTYAKNFNFLFPDFKLYEQEFLVIKKEMFTLCQSQSDNSQNTIIKNENTQENKIYNENKSFSVRIVNNSENYLGGGHFCYVFAGTISNSKSLVAIKKPKNDTKQINRETSLLKYLNGINGIPKIINVINQKGSKAIITNLCGPSLDKLHYFCGSKFDEITTIMIGINVLKILKSIHAAGVIHRDIKPANICYGAFSGNNNNFVKSLILIDFGLGKNYSNKNLRNKENKIKRPFAGTLIFASTSALEGLQLYPKDDIENLFYVMVYFKTGTLPWLKLKSENKKEFSQKILKMHYSISTDVLFEGFSKEVKFIFKSLSNLKQQDTPEYDIYIENLELALHKLKQKEDKTEIKYIWELKLQKICGDLSSLKTNREDLLQVSYLKRGYPFNIELFLKLFKT